MMQPGCDTCKHYRGGITCDAYPDFIPLPILAGDVPHFQSLPGYDTIPDDGGIVYEPMDEEEMKGGPGSGNWRHAGRPGHRGGSMGGGGHNALLDSYGYTPRGVEPKAPASGKVSGTNLDPFKDLPHLTTISPVESLDDKVKSSGNSDNVLADIVKQQGFDGPADVVTKEQMDKYVADGEVQVFRGVHPSSNAYRDPITGKPLPPDKVADAPNDYNDQYRSGNFWIGVGIYGNGIYSSTDKATAESFAGGPSSRPQDVMRLTLKKDARIIGYNELESIQTKMRDEVSARDSERFGKVLDAAKNGEAAYKAAYEQYKAEREALDPIERALKELYNDPGRVAALQGYDAIKVNQGRNEDYYVILNRTATRVQE